jgi:Zn-dependent oligopeptidase
MELGRGFSSVFRRWLVQVLVQVLVLGFVAGAIPAARAMDPGCPEYLLDTNVAHNPLVYSEEFQNGTIPWARIRPGHFIPALKHQLQEFEVRFRFILSFPDPANFVNTVLAVQLSAQEFERTISIYSIYSSNHNTPQIQRIQDRVSDLENTFYERMMQNEVYFERVTEALKGLRPGTEEYEITRRIHQEFLERGINLPKSERVELSLIERRLSELGSKFSNQVRIQDNAVRVKIADLSVLDGIPEKWIQWVKDTRDEAGFYWIPLKNHSLVTQIMESARSPELRRKVFFAESSQEVASRYITAEEAGDAWKVDNRPVLLEIVALRERQAKILGHQSFAEAVLKDRMAQSTEQVRKLYDDLLPGIQVLAEREKRELRAFVKSIDPTLTVIQPWDRSYFVKRQYQQKFNLDPDRISEYFEANRTISAVLDFYSGLFNIRFEKLPNAASWLPEVEVYRIIDGSTGYPISELHLDLYTRSTKSGGAWKASIQKAGVTSGGRQRSIQEITMNLDHAPNGQPTLLRISDVNTLFHELGHAMHEAFSKTHCTTLAGTCVMRDFVEFPSQIMENWLYTPEFLSKGARHYQTGEPMPADWIERIREADRFRIGTRLRRQVMLGLIDLHWHSNGTDFLNPAGNLPADLPANFVQEFEKGLYEQYGIERMSEFSPISPSFTHIFSGGYAMGYYSYLWGNVIEADGFEYWVSDPARIKEKALKLKEVLSKGGTVDPNELYRAWTGKPYSVDAFLRRCGL